MIKNIYIENIKFFRYVLTIKKKEEGIKERTKKE